MRKMLLILVVLMVSTALVASLFQLDTDFQSMVQDTFGTVEKIGNAIQKTSSTVKNIMEDAFPDNSEYEDPDYPQGVYYNAWVGDETAFSQLYYCFITHADFTGQYINSTTAGTPVYELMGERVFMIEGTMEDNPLTKYPKAVFVRLDDYGKLMAVYYGPPNWCGRPMYDSALNYTPNNRDYAYMVIVKPTKTFATLNISQIKEAIDNAS